MVGPTPVARRRAGVPQPDEEEAGHAGHLPEAEQRDEIVAEHQPQHRAAKTEQVGVEPPEFLVLREVRDRV